LPCICAIYQIPLANTEFDVVIYSILEEFMSVKGIFNLIFLCIVVLGVLAMVCMPLFFGGKNKKNDAATNHKIVKYKLYALLVAAIAFLAILIMSYIK
jgi:heme/copper-type cytochrome/quinol oxidase subunit 2